MKIIVAGAGHGGLVAAAKLAKAGYDVSVFEKREENSLGYDWEDRFTFDILLSAVDKDTLDDNVWSYRGDCAFISPSYKKEIVINYSDENRQKVMWRKPVIAMLLSYARECGAELIFGKEIISPIIIDGAVKGVRCNDGEYYADLVIDSLGVFSSLRQNLSADMAIRKKPVRGDLFYAYRAYFGNTDPEKNHNVPFEIYLCHNKEQGLSWVNTSGESVDVLIGRIDEMSDEKINEQIATLRKNHPWIGNEILHGGIKCVIPVCRPLALMVANGYAAVGDSAFMTTPMNGMGIDLSILAGELLAKTITDNGGDISVENLWKYNRDFHRLYGGETAKNEGLKNSLLNMSDGGVDFLFENGIIASSDLAGAGKNTKLSDLLLKFVRGMKNPKYFFKLLGGLIGGGKVAKIYKKAPASYDTSAILKWQEEIEAAAIRVIDK